MAAGLVDRVQVTIFPVVSGQTGTRPIFEGAADFDLELIEARTLDGQHPGAHLPADASRLTSFTSLEDPAKVSRLLSPSWAWQCLRSLVDIEGLVGHAPLIPSFFPRH